MVQAAQTPAAPETQTAEEKAAAARNLEALKVQHSLYVKIQAYTPVDADQADAVLRASEVFLEALKTVKVTPTKADIVIHPLTEAQVKKAAEETRKAEEKAKAEAKH
jgi:hypothetical protein